MKKQCKDIPDLPILRFLNKSPGQCHFWRASPDYADRDVARGMPEGTPVKLVLAKMKSLIRRQLVDGCGCGCRGDFHITERGQWLLSEATAAA